jgi:membrane fusion protein
MSELFRREAVSFATRRLAGPVIIATPLSLKLLGGLLAGIVFGATAFAATATYARKATVTGWLVPDQGLIRATARAPGLIQRLFVKEGEMVEQGARIAELGLAVETASGNVGETVERSLLAEANALKARSAGQKARLEAEAAQSKQRISSLNREIEQARAQSALQEQRVALAQDLVIQSQGIAAKGLLSKKDFDDRKSAALAAEQELAVGRRLLASLEREIDDLEARLVAIPIEISTANAEGQSAAAALEQRAADAASRHTQFVLAPIAGRVGALPRASGQAVDAGTAIAVLMPVGGRLEAELLIPSRAIGFVRKGQEVRLMLQAFPHQRFGTINGTVRTVSSTVLGPTEFSIPGLNIDEPVFRVRVRLPKETMDAYGAAIRLQPGMLLAADIVFDRRSLIEWLFDPIYAVMRT